MVKSDASVMIHEGEPGLKWRRMGVEMKVDLRVWKVWIVSDRRAKGFGVHFLVREWRG